MTPLSGFLEYVRWRADRYAAGRRAYIRRTPVPPPPPRSEPEWAWHGPDFARWEEEMEP